MNMHTLRIVDLVHLAGLSKREGRGEMVIDARTGQSFGRLDAGEAARLAIGLIHVQRNRAFNRYQMARVLGGGL